MSQLLWLLHKCSSRPDRLLLWSKDSWIDKMSHHWLPNQPSLGLPHWTKFWEVPRWYVIDQIKRLSNCKRCLSKVLHIYSNASAFTSSGSNMRWLLGPVFASSTRKWFWVHRRFEYRKPKLAGNAMSFAIGMLIRSLLWRRDLPKLSNGFELH